MTPDLFVNLIMDPALTYIAGMPEIGIKESEEADLLMCTIAGQETTWAARRQIGYPYYPQTAGARGWYQFEKYGALNEVLLALPKQMAALCGSLAIPTDLNALFEAIAWNDILSVAMARLLLWKDPMWLPSIGDEEGSWQYYKRNWRPGMPDRARWTQRYATARETLGL